MENKDYRVGVGQRLKAFRKDRGLTVAQVAGVGNISIEQVRMVESGSAAYPVDVFFGYVHGCDLYMYFAEKTEGRKLPHDLDDISRKGIENDPRKKAVLPE